MFSAERLADGRQRVVGNGHLPWREILTGVGGVEVRVPKSRSRSGSPTPFRSSLVPPYVSAQRESGGGGSVAVPARRLHGPDARGGGGPGGRGRGTGLSANVVSRLKRVWDEAYRSWCRRRLHDDWVYLWADGIHSGLRGADGRLCVLVVVIGVDVRGEKHFLAIEDGVRESTQSWREVLLGFWSALSEMYPQTRTQRCWMHKSGNVLQLPAEVEPA